MATRLVTFVVLAGIGTIVASPALAQSTHAPVVSLVASGGLGWLDGQYDALGDRPHPDPCSDPTFVCSPLARFGQHHVAALFAAGVSFGVPMRERLALVVTIDGFVGPTRGVGQDVPNTWPGAAHGRAYEPRSAFGSRVAVTARLGVGSLRRGFVGAGLRVGVLLRVSRDGVWIPNSLDPDPYFAANRVYRDVGATLEALAEGGAFLDRRRRVALSVVAAGGRPRFRAELVLSFRPR